ncbi:receptor like protein 21-like isoform X1 [Hevea brasiliensis]|uniref:receptor like protein 21-like isoform X1 n=1 Tax=Hevea brasiliensis TaxID=3981 RepID=UPI0025CEB4C5|nr:receptor like protein 21-like isoform X1 [Hevea brasiliensis]
MSNCCKWERVKCNSTTGHVTELSLNNTRQYDIESISFYDDENIWFAKFSMFQQLKELRSLNLSYNRIGGFIDDTGFETLSELKKLEVLDLSSNYFNNSILSSLNNLTSLKTLILSDNIMEGSFPCKGFERLEELDISYNGFNNSILSSLGALTSLKTLILRENNMEGSFPIQELISDLKNLESLDVSWNRFNITLPFQAFKSNFSKVSKLKYLDMSWNNFNNGILSFSSIFPSVETLDLSSNNLEGPLSYKDLVKLKNLTVLNFRGNNLNGTLPLQKLSKLKNLKSLDVSGNRLNSTLPFQELSTFKSLEILNLMGNEFTGSIPEYMWTPTSLKVLSLYHNKLNGTLPNQSLCGLKGLQELDLGYNEFGGSLPQCLDNLTSLTFLDLSGNQLTGHIPSSWPANLKFIDLSYNRFEGIFSVKNIPSSSPANFKSSLKFIDLSNNLFEGLFSFNLLANYSSLEALILSGNNITFETGWIPSFQLKVLIMQSCGLDSIPDFLFHQFKLEALDLSHNKVKGWIPNWLLENNGGLQTLNLENNSFNGQLQEIGTKMLPNMRYLNLARNYFQGDFLFAVGDDCKLMSLDLSHNNFSGEVPKELLSSCIFLTHLRLSYNNFHGQIMIFNITRFDYLQLNDNQFEGTLASLLPNFSHQMRGPEIEWLDLSNNRLHGEIPHWMGNFTSLRYVNLHNNFFEGRISKELLSIEYLDLSHNNFSGPLPSFFHGNYLEQINLQGNRFIGSIPEAFFNISTLEVLDLSNNELSGTIPNNTGEFQNDLRVLLLGENHLSGFIPNWLCQQKYISLLDLSRNFLSGSIPHCLHNLSFGKEEGDFYGSTIVSMSSQYMIPISLHKSFDTFYFYEDIEEEIEFLTKYRASTYKYKALNYMSGLDLSANNLTGEIPHKLGELSQILALNLSHNQLIGSIPRSFSNLSQIESLDLSYNNLSGEIPSKLIDLNFLEVFSVAHNNLSGKIPYMKGQFSTFESNSYEGNPFLCGPQVERKCNDNNVESPSSQVESRHGESGKWYEIDRGAFLVCFSVTFIISFLVAITFLYVHPYWQQGLIYHSKEYMFSCYYFLFDILLNLYIRFVSLINVISS